MQGAAEDIAIEGYFFKRRIRVHDTACTGPLQRLESGKGAAVLSVGDYHTVGFAFFQLSLEGKHRAVVGVHLQHGKVTAEHRPALHVIHVHIQLHIFGNGIGGPQAYLNMLQLRVENGDIMRNQKYLFAIGRRGGRSLLRRIGEGVFAGVCRSSGGVALWQQQKKQHSHSRFRQNAQRLWLKR